MGDYPRKGKIRTHSGLENLSMCSRCCHDTGIQRERKNKKNRKKRSSPRRVEELPPTRLGIPRQRELNREYQGLRGKVRPMSSNPVRVLPPLETDLETCVRWRYPVSTHIMVIHRRACLYGPIREICDLPDPQNDQYCLVSIIYEQVADAYAARNYESSENESNNPEVRVVYTSSLYRL